MNSVKDNAYHMLPNLVVSRNTDPRVDEKEHLIAPCCEAKKNAQYFSFLTHLLLNHIVVGSLDLFYAALALER